MFKLQRFTGLALGLPEPPWRPPPEPPIIDPIRRVRAPRDLPRPEPVEPEAVPLRPGEEPPSPEPPRNYWEPPRKISAEVKQWRDLVLTTMKESSRVPETWETFTAKMMRQFGTRAWTYLEDLGQYAANKALHTYKAADRMYGGKLKVSLQEIQIISVRSVYSDLMDFFYNSKFELTDAQLNKVAKKLFETVKTNFEAHKYEPLPTMPVYNRPPDW